MDAPIYDSAGLVVGWIENGTDIFDRHNRDRGFIEGDGVFSPRARYLGGFEDGFFWDRHGRAVAFVDGARGGPVTPVTQVAPVSPIHPITAVRPVTPVTPVTPVHSLAWSTSTFEEFLSA